MLSTQRIDALLLHFTNASVFIDPHKATFLNILNICLDGQFTFYCFNNIFSMTWVAGKKKKDRFSVNFSFPLSCCIKIQSRNLGVIFTKQA